LFEFGRYILMCSSRPGGLPANLQGVWSGTWTPSWSCDYTLNENVEMAYWQVLPGNMAEVTEAYFDYFDSLVGDWKTNARQFWGCRGIIGFMRCSDHGLMLQYAPWQFWTGAAGWLGQLYYDYYLYTGDEEFLAKRAVPFLKEVALFYEDFLTEDENGKYVFSPSMSPENQPANSRSKVTVNATMDVAIAKEVLRNLISACEQLGIEQEGVSRWRTMLGKMPEYELDAEGAMKEWIHPGLANRDLHRHMSHMYPVFPGFEIDCDRGEAKIRQGCIKVLNRKLEFENRKLKKGDVFGWSYAHLANCFARLGEGQKALDCLRGVAVTCSEQNLFSLFEPPDGPFQIDGNCGFSAAVQEMLVYSRPGVIKVLPAIPGSWKRGKVKHMLCRGGVEISIDWDMEARRIDARLKSRTEQSIRIKYPLPVAEVVSSETASVKLRKSDDDSRYWIVNLPAGKEVGLKARLAGEVRGPVVLKAEAFRHYVDYFNGMEPENIVNYVPNAKAWEWMKANIPLFECPDKDFERIYYYRWWTYRKHIKQTPKGFVLTEFLAQVGHSGEYNTISCALGHHIYEGRWLRDKRYLDDYIRFWYRGNNGGLEKRFHRYSNWASDAVYNRYLVNGEKDFLVGLLDAMVKDFEGWEKERGAVSGLFWQYDVLDGMEESISGSRHRKNIRPPLNSYMYANAVAIAKTAEMAGRGDIARKYWAEAARIKSLVENLLWNGEDKFFEVRDESGPLADVREEIGLIPWYFNLPDGGYEEAWVQILEPMGFKAPMGLMTAERRHPGFRSRGVGTCEWDGAVWPYATSQTLVGLANVLRNYEQGYVTKKDYFEELLKYARSHEREGRPYIGEYLDERTGQWLTKDSDRSRYYNHSTFCDLVISGLCGIVPRGDDTVEVWPLVPVGAWDWFCLDNVPYHGKILTVVWDRTGEKYGKGKGLRVFANGREVAQSDMLERVTGKLR